MKLTVPGEPVAWQRARSRGKRRFTDPKVAAHAEEIRAAWLAAGRPAFEPGEPLSLTLQFVFTRPPSHFRTGRNAHLLREQAPTFPPPDVDNCVKLALDSLNGCAWPDDSQVVVICASKRYGEEARTELRAGRG